jgi:hypothetical protein
MWQHASCCCRGSWWYGAHLSRHSNRLSSGQVRNANEAAEFDPLGNPALKISFGLQLELVARVIADGVGKAPVLLLANAAQRRIVQVFDGGRIRGAARLRKIHRQAAPVAVVAEGRAQGLHAHG